MCPIFPCIISNAYVIFSKSSSFMRKCILSIFYVVFSFWSDVLFVIQEIKGGLHFTHTRVNRCFIYTNAEASRECVWRINQHIRSSSGIDENIKSTILYEDNMKIMRHVLLKQKKIYQKQCSRLLHKITSYSVYRKHVYNIRMRHQNNL